MLTPAGLGVRPLPAWFDGAAFSAYAESVLSRSLASGDVVVLDNLCPAGPSSSFLTPLAHVILWHVSGRISPFRQRTPVRPESEATAYTPDDPE